MMSCKFCGRSISSLLLVGGLVLIGHLTGCGGGDAVPTSAESAKNQPAESSASANNHADDDTDTVGQKRASERKYVDGIPYDVFYDQPLTVAAENTNLPVPSMTATATPAPSMVADSSPPLQQPAATPATPAATETAGNSWENIISKELLIEEVMRLRNTLTANLNSVGNFNRELLTIQGDASVLAALAGIATEHPGDFTWKPNAKYVRDFASTIAMAAESRGRPAFETAEKPFLNIVEILGGGSPAELPEAEEVTTFSDIAERSMLMKQVKINADWMQTTISSEGEMKKNKAEIIAKATVLAVIGEVISQEDYVFADEAEYQSYCKELVEGSLKIVNGANNESFDDFRAGFDLVNKSCNDCHPTYLNN